MKKTNNKIFRNKEILGFSLVELIVSIAIMAVLLAILVPSLLTYVERSRAQKDVSAMDEVINAVQLAMADQDCYDEMLYYSYKNNYITYTDSSGKYGEQIKDGEYWAPDGAGIATTITFNPSINQNGESSYMINEAILNNMAHKNGSIEQSRVMIGESVGDDCYYLKDATLIDGTTTACMYNRIRQTIGDEIQLTSQMYRNSSFTIFIVFSQEDGTTVPSVYGLFNGTNLYDGAPASAGSGTDSYDEDEDGNKIPIDSPISGGIVESVMLAPSSTWYKGSTPRSSITEINIVRQYKPTGNEIESWSAAVDKDGDGSLDNDIMCYITGTKLTIAGNGTSYIVANPDSSYAFSDRKRKDMFTNVVAINGSELLNTSNVTSMSGMFYMCTSVKSLNVTNWKTGNVTDFSGLFCGSDHIGNMMLEDIDVSNWDTSSAVKMNSMFYGCAKLTELDLSKWNVSNVTTVSHMFADCKGLENINLSNWNTYSLESLDAVFNDCDSIVTIDVSDLDTGKVTYFSQIFEGCNSLTTIIGLENWNTSNGIVFVQIFAYMPKLKELNLSSWDMSSAVYFTDMFRNCSSLEKIYVSDLWNLTSLKETTIGVDSVKRSATEDMFRGCAKLVGGDGTTYKDKHLNYDTDTEDYIYAHVDGGADNPGYLTYKERPQ